MNRIYLLGFLLGLSLIGNAFANSGGITGQSTIGCVSSGCHGHNGASAVGPYRYTGTIYGDSTGSWGTGTQTIENNVALDLLFFLNRSSGSSAPRFGMDMSTSGGSLSETSGSLQLLSSEVTHTSPNSTSCAGGGPAGCAAGDKQYNLIAWSPPASTSGDFTISACGNVVDNDGTADTDDSDSTGGLCDTLSIAVRPNVTFWSGTLGYSEDSGYQIIDSSITQTSANLREAVVTLTNQLTGDQLACPSIATAGISCAVSGGNSVLTFTPTTGTSFAESSFETAVQRARYRNTSQNPSTTNRSVTLRVRDVDFNYSTTDTKTISVSASNDSPVITQGASTSTSMSEDGTPTPFNLTLNATDPENDTLTWSILSQPTLGTGTASASGTGSSKAIGYTPPANYTGSTSFVVRVTDNGAGSLTDTITVNVTINPVNDPPVITEGSTIAVVMSEDGSPTPFSLVLNATDPETDPISWSIGSVASNGTAVASGTSLSTVINYTPNANFNGIDSFIVTATAASLTDNITVNVTINAVNDAPQLTAIGNQTATENILFSLDAGSVFSDVEDANNGTAITWDFQSGQPAGMSISALGVIQWTPPQTGVFNQSYGPIVVRATDGEPSSGTTSFNITVSPPDSDSDGLADYNDLCLTIPDATNADNDGDGTAGSDGGVNDGGDVCDLDDDNDGIPDTFETANGLDPFDSADAALDADSDGISNLDEFLAGTNLNFANLTIDSTGYLTPYLVLPPIPTTVAAGASDVVGTTTVIDSVTAAITPVIEPLITVDKNGAYRPGHHDITWTALSAVGAVLDTSIQSFDIRPIVSLAADQQTVEGNAVNVVATLNGIAAIYPVTVNFTVSGTADASDHTAVDSSFTFVNPNQMASYSFNVTADTLNEGLETIVFTLTSATNAVLASDVSHSVSIAEGNVSPVLSLQIRQGGNDVSTVYVPDGPVTVNAVVTDGNSTQTHTYDWSMTNNSLSPPTDTTSASWTFTPVAGKYLIDVNSTDSGTPALSNRVNQILSIASIAPVLASIDSDGDGTNDDDPTEGLDDSDQDGIPNYLDAQSAGVTDQHLIPNQTVSQDNSAWFLIQTEPGLKIVIGNTARASSNNGVLVTDANIASFGSVLGGAPLNATDSFEHVGGIYDFEVSGLIPGQSANIVIPLQSAIPAGAVFRKYNPASGWSNFVVDNNNRLSSASGGVLLGACPEPGSSDYVAGLIALNSCLQLTIQDGGANDADGTANGVIKDPGSLGVVLKTPATPSVRGSGQIDLMVLLGLILLIGFKLAGYSRMRTR